MLGLRAVERELCRALRSTRKSEISAASARPLRGPRVSLAVRAVAGAPESLRHPRSPLSPTLCIVCGPFGPVRLTICQQRDVQRVVVRLEDRDELLGDRGVELHPRVEELVTYVYAVIDDEGAQALATSRLMLARSVPPRYLGEFRRGREEATAIVEMLSYLGPQED